MSKILFRKDNDSLMKYFLIGEVVIAILIIIILLANITFSKNGIISFCKLRMQISKKHSQIQELVLENYKLNKMIESLKDEDGLMVERIAREKLMLLKPGEVVYLIQPEN